eukprot:8620638-Pyramimonas_sp.AAC.1
MRLWPRSINLASWSLRAFQHMLLEKGAMRPRRPETLIALPENAPPNPGMAGLGHGGGWPRWG